MKNLDVLLLPWKKAFSEAFSIRKTVFIDEQNVPEELELDEYDPQALHALAKFGMQFVGTARLVDLGNGQAQIGRMAVLAQYRNQGFGKQILEGLIWAAKEKGISSIILHSQVSAMPFYEKLGFIAQGPIYSEANIPHRNMMLVLTKAPDNP